MIAFLSTLICFLSAAVSYCLHRWRLADSVFIRDLLHFYSAIFLVYAITLVCTVEKQTPVKPVDIRWGISGTLGLAIIWEIFIQNASRYILGQAFRIQWEQIIFEVSGVGFASLIWLYC